MTGMLLAPLLCLVAGCGAESDETTLAPATPTMDAEATVRPRHPRADTWDERTRTPVSVEVDPAVETRTFRIVTEGGVPASGCYVRWRTDTGAWQPTLADADGYVTTDIPLDRDTRLTARVCGHDRPVPIDEAPVVVVPHGPELEFQVVDSRTDEPISGTCVRIDGARSDTDRALLLGDQRGRLGAVLPEDLVECPLGVWDVLRLEPASRVAKSYRLTLPVRPELVLPLRLTFDEDPGSVGASVGYTGAAGESRPDFHTRPGGERTATARGWASFLGERVWVQAHSATHVGGSGALVHTLGRQPPVTVNLRRRDPPRDGGGAFAGRRGGHRNFSGRGSGGLGPSPRGTAVIQAFRRDGRVAADIDLSRGGRTDDNGRVTLPSLRVGRYTIAFDEPGVVPSTTAFEVVADQTTHIELRESPGRRITLVSRDPSGVPLPYARVHVSQPSGVDYVRIDHDHIADLALWTDSKGRIELTHVEDERVSLTVRYGSRRVSVDVPLDRDHVEAVFQPVE